MRKVNINGKLHSSTSAAVPYDNRAFRFGFGLFETMLIIDGQIQLKEYHFDRLMSSLSTLRFEIPELMTQEWIEEEILRTVAKNKLQKLARVRFQIYAGRGGLYDGQNQWAEFVIECKPVEAHLLQLNEKGITSIYAEGFNKSVNDIANFKSCNAMVYMLSARLATRNKVDDAIILNCNDNAIETTLANLFCIKGDVIYTPPLSEGCIAGVMRKYLIEHLPQKGFTVEEKPFTRDFLASADSVFMTNAIRRLKWIERIGDKTYSIGKILDIYEQISY